MDSVVAHATLRVSPAATPEEIRAAYRRRAFETHPDRAAGSTAEFQAVAEAYRVLSDPTHAAQDPGRASDASSRVPGTDAAKVLFEYLGDLASEMILNGAAPDAIVAFLAREGCPESVARALERDLRRRVQPAASEGSRGPPSPARSEQEHARASTRSAACPPPGRGEGVPREPAATSGPRARVFPPFARWLAVALAPAAVMACALAAWRITATVRASEPRSETASPVAAAVARPGTSAVAQPGTPAGAQPGTPAVAPPGTPAAHGGMRTSSPAAMRPADPARSPATRPQSQAHVRPPKQPARAGEAHSLGAVSAAIDAERVALEADRSRFTAEAAELESERQRIDAAATALGAGGDPARIAALRRRQAAFNARLEAARRTEKGLQRRTHDLNARIVAYNGRVRSERQR